MKNVLLVRSLSTWLVFAIVLSGFSLLKTDTLYAASKKKEVRIEVPASEVDINTAGLDELQTVRGIGPALAERILNYRREFGGFETLDDLANVRGIGGAKLRKIKAQVTL